MKPLFIKKNGTVSKVSGIIMNLIPSYTMAEYNALTHKPLLWVRTDENYAQIPSEDVSYGSGSVEDALDGLTAVVLEKISITDIGALSNGASGYKSGTCPSHSGYTPVMAVSQASRVGALGGNLITNCSLDGNTYYINYKALTDISAANSAINVYVYYQKTS